jgi:hypothetical protein
MHSDAAAFGVRARGQQHLAHVGMKDDLVRRFVGILHARQRTALDPLLRIRDRVLIRHLRQPKTLHADAKACAVHHHEHRIEALVRLADQPTGRAVENDLASRVAVDTHLVFDAAAVDTVALADSRRTARAFGNELGNDEERDALGARRRIRQARKYEVHDVLGHLVLAGRNEDLVAGKRIAAVAARLGLGAQHA